MFLVTARRSVPGTNSTPCSYHIETHYENRTPLVLTTKLRQGVTDWIGSPASNVFLYGFRHFNF